MYVHMYIYVCMCTYTQNIFYYIHETVPKIDHILDRMIWIVIFIDQE